MRESEHPRVIGSFEIPDDKILLFQYPKKDDYCIYRYNEDCSDRGTLVECAQELGIALLQRYIDKKERIVKKWN